MKMQVAEPNPLLLLWEKRLAILLTAFGFGLLGAGYSLWVDEIYRAQVVVSPVTQKSLPGGLGQLGNLAALAGISVGATSSSESIATLRSQELSRDFIETQDLVSKLSPAGLFEKQTDIRDAIRVFEEKVLAVSEDKRTGLVTITIDWTDADEAARWANELVRLANERIRSRALIESKRNVEYLKTEIAGTVISSLQQSVGQVLQTELQKLMLAQGNDQFAFKVIDPATPPKQRHSPRRTLITLAAAIFGFLVASVSVLVWPAFRRAFQRPTT